MGSIGERLGELGYAGDHWHYEGEIDPGERLIHLLPAAEDGRVVIVAIGEAGPSNLDLVVRGPRGTVEAEDSATDRRAAVELATSAGRTYEVELVNAASDAATAFSVRAFHAPPETEPAPLFGLFDADPLAATGWDGVESRARAQGMDAELLARELRVGRGERHSERIRVEAGTCYLFACQGSPGIDSVALRLSAKGGLLVADLSGRRIAWARHCAETSEEAKLTVEVIAGSGQVRLGAFAGDRDNVDEALVGPPLRPREPLATVDAAIRWTDQQLARAGYDPAEIQLESELAAGEREERTVRLAAGECAVFSAVSGPGVRDLDIEVKADGGELVAADSTLGPASLVRFCSPGETEYRVSIIGRGGEGFTVMLVSRLPRIELPVSSGRHVPRVAREAAALLRRFSLEPLAEITGATLEGEDRDRAWVATIELERGRCYGIAAAASGARIDRLELRRPGGEITSSWKNDGLPPTLASCADETGEFGLRVRLDGGAGESPPLLLLFRSESATYAPIGSP